MMKNENSTTNNNNNNNYDTIKVTNGRKTTVTTTANVVVVKSEPGDDSSSPSSSPGLEDQARKGPIKMREKSPYNKDANKSLSQTQVPTSNGHTHTNGHNGHLNGSGGGMTNDTSSKPNGTDSNGHVSDSDSVTSVKSEKNGSEQNKNQIENGSGPRGDKDGNREEKMEIDFDIRSTNGVHSLSSSPRSLLSSASSNGSRGSPPRPQNGTSNGMSPRRSPPQNGMRDNLNQPSLFITKSKQGDRDRDSYNNSTSQRSSPMSHHSGSGSSRGGSPPHILNLNSHIHHHLPPHLAMLNGHGPPGLFHATQLHARLTENRNRDNSPSNGSSPLMAHLSGGGSDKGDPPLSVVTSTSLSFHQSSLYRINGVRPEVISGGAVTPVSGSSPRPASNGGGGGSPPSGSTPNNNPSPHHLPPQHHHNHHNHNSNSNHLHQLIPNGSSAQHHQHPTHNGSIALNGLNHHLSPFPIQGNRKSPNSHHSRSPNSSPSNSSSSGSIQHSPGSTGSGGTIIAGGSIGMVNSSTPQTNGTHHVNLSRTPTVIMGKCPFVMSADQMFSKSPGYLN